MPWHGCPPAPARPITGDGKPTNSRVTEFTLPPRRERGLLIVTIRLKVCTNNGGPAGQGRQVMGEWRNPEFDLGGVNHLALVCSDMQRTVDFYTNVLGMRLIKTIELPAAAVGTVAADGAGGTGQHFFFDMGGGNALAFFWFPDVPDPVPGVSNPVAVPGIGEWTSA